MHTYTLNFKSAAELSKKVVATISTSVGLIEIFEYTDSGRVITREKIDTITKVFHPGIIIGKDIWNRIWVAHNHYSNKRPTFDLLAKFSESKQPLWDNRQVNFSQKDIVQRAIAEVVKGKEYKWANYNCQTFVNLIVRDEHVSEAVDKISDGTIYGGLLLAFFGAITKNKAATIAGLVIAGTGGATKGYSRIR